MKTDIGLSSPSGLHEALIKINSRFFKNRARLAKDRNVIARSKMFDSKYYRETYGIPEHKDAILHFCRVGWKNGNNPSKFFDVKFYLDTYRDVRSNGFNPLVHYLTDGAFERRVPSRALDVNAFCTAHPKYDFTKNNPAEICIELYGTYDWSSGRHNVVVLPDDVIEDFKPYFDADFYASMNCDTDINRDDAYLHFINIGQYENRDPYPEFDMYAYRMKIKNNEELLANPIFHFIKVGRKMGLATAAPNDIHLELAQIDRTSDASLKVCVHVHCFYPEILRDLIPAFENLPAEIPVVITVVTDADGIFVRNRLAKEGLPHTFDVRVVPNKGRDLGPFLVGCRDLWNSFDVLLHIHTKVSPHLGWGEEWRHYLFDQTLGSRALIQSVIARFASEPDIGALFPRNYFEIRRFTTYEPNQGAIEAFLRRLDLPTMRTTDRPFPAGSMAWYRTAALRKLTDQNFGLDLFEEEQGQLDMTLAHALERVLPAVVQAAGYRACSYMTARRSRLTSKLDFPGRESSVAAIPPRWNRDTPRIAQHAPRPVAPLSRHFNPAALDIHWVLPSFVRGAGGHMTIFRMVDFLERFGHRQTLWFQNAREFADQAEAKRRIQEWYRPIGARVHVRFLPEDVRQLAGDVLIATDCWTAYPAALAQNFKERFYLVQDDEPSFHPTGELQLLAEATYGFGFAALCAGTWLYDLMTARGCWARSWDLCADHDVYYPGVPRPQTNRPVRIAFYARPYTPRRAVSLGFAAFEILQQRGVKFHVDLFGEADLKLDFAFPHTQHGILTPEELGELYRSSDLGVVFSTTNYSLIPLEMMACGLPVVEVDRPSTRAIFRNGEVTFAAPTPYGIADAVEGLIGSPERQDAQRRSGEAFVANTSWEGSARIIEAALIERLGGLGYRETDPAALAAPALAQARKATVFIPTHNAGPAFAEVLDRVSRQVCDFAYDVLVIDSESTDGTFERAKGFADRGVRTMQIRKAAFQHGRTRNLGIAESDGAYVAIITQDALPKDADWLGALIGGFARGPRVAGVIGRHEAYPEHDAFTKRDMIEMFDGLADLPQVIDRDVGLPSYIYPGGQTWRMLSQFYSDNNSAMSREAWKILPYPEIAWGEDQVWADEALRLGFQKAYVNDAVVYHSHDFDLPTVYETAMTEGRFWAERFGFELHPDMKASLAAMDARDRAYAIQAGISAEALAHRLKVNRSQVQGRQAGYAASSASLGIARD